MCMAQPTKQVQQAHLIHNRTALFCKLVRCSNRETFFGSFILRYPSRLYGLATDIAGGVSTVQKVPYLTIQPGASRSVNSIEQRSLAVQSNPAEAVWYAPACWHLLTFLQKRFRP